MCLVVVEYGPRYKYYMSHEKQLIRSRLNTNVTIYKHIKCKNVTVLMSHGVAAGSMGLEGDGPTTLRLQTKKFVLEYVKRNEGKDYLVY